MTAEGYLWWTPAISFALHVAEEYPRFPRWATRHFGATSRSYYVYSHIVLVAANILICAAAAQSSAPVWRTLAVAVQWILFTNGLFHLATTILFREYSPGVVTGTVLFFPATFIVLRDAQLPPRAMATALALGTVASALIIATLWLDANLDWRLRRVTS